MFLFKKHKKFTHKQTSVVGFVLAVMSILVSAVLTYGFPHFATWLNLNGVFHLDAFLLIFVATLFLSLQGLILFGFPLYYANDKKSHMTGFQILLYALMWMILIVALVSLAAVSMSDEQAPELDLDQFLLEMQDAQPIEEPLE
jgi:hypothetical protein